MQAMTWLKRLSRMEMETSWMMGSSTGTRLPTAASRFVYGWYLGTATTGGADGGRRRGEREDGGADGGRKRTAE